MNFYSPDSNIRCKKSMNQIWVTVLRMGKSLGRKAILKRCDLNLNKKIRIFNFEFLD